MKSTTFSFDESDLSIYKHNLKTHCASNTNLTAKGAKRVFFKNSFLYMSCQTFVQYIRMICPGRFILVESVYKCCFHFFSSLMLPTLNEILYDYNPYYHVCKYCVRCSTKIAKQGFGVVKKVRKVINYMTFVVKKA